MNSIQAALLLVPLLVCSLDAKEPVSPAAAAAQTASAPLKDVAWAPDGNSFAYLRDDALHVFEVAPGRSRKVLDTGPLESQAQAPPEPERFTWQNRRVREKTLQWFPDSKRVLLKVKGDLFSVNVADGESTQITSTSLDEADPKLSGDGHHISFRCGNDLCVLDLRRERVKQLTRDGNDHLWNGRLDWVYPEELDLGTAHWWAPDSESVAYLQFNVAREEFYPHADLLGLRAIDEPQRYPKAGTPNADVRLGVVTRNGGRTRWLYDIGGDSDLIARVNWLPDSSGLVIQKLNRIQDRLELILVPSNGKPAKTIFEETGEHWVDVADDLCLFKGSNRLLWSSERSGFRHLYVYDLNGNQVKQLTDGDWEVSGVEGADEESGRVFFTSTEAGPLERRLYSVSLNGGGRACLTTRPGTHSINMSPDCGHYLDTFSSLREPPRTTLHAIGGDRIAVVSKPDNSAAEKYNLLPQEIVTVRTPDNATLYGSIVKPAGFEPGKKYPAVVMVYGGPHAQSVRNSWSGADLKQALAHAGYVVWQLDNRGSAGRGHDFETPLYRRFGKVELEDQLTGLDHLISLGFVDPGRIGVYGWSYGGYMTLNCMLNAPDRFHAGVSGAPVTDFRLYDTIYTERYLGLPKDNAEGYEQTSLLPETGNLKGDLMIIHNFQDDNVLFQNTLRMADALQKANKQFEMMIYPQKTHGVTGAAKTHLYATIVNFFEQELE